MVIDRVSVKAMETLLNITFGEKGNHYEFIAKDGMNYDKLDVIERDLNSHLKKAYSPFSTFITKQVLSEQVESYKAEHLLAGLNDIKSKGLFSLFKGLSMKPEKKEELIVISTAAEKCISDELVKSQRILESSEFENPSIMLLVKGIKNIETPEKVVGLTPKNVQEIGAIQIGMALNEMKRNVPHLFSFDIFEEKAFKRALSTLVKNKFIDDCCQNALSQENHIHELNIASKQDAQFDAFLKGGDEIDYSSSFKNIQDVDKTRHINEIKQTARHKVESNRFK